MAETGKGEQGSRTAKLTAGMRAMESEKPEGKRLCYDSYARRFAGSEGMEFAQKMVNALPMAVMVQAVRTRYIDDYLRQRVVAGIEQIVIFGAGYDSRALRVKEIKERIPVFEIDEPATSRAKQETVKAVEGALPSWVIYISVDFMKETLEDLKGKMLERSYSPQQKNLFIVEGVMGYLDAEAVDNLLLFISSFAGSDSSVIFDYHDRAKLHQRFAKFTEKFKKIGEPVSFGIDSTRIGKFLEKRGYQNVYSLAIDEIKLRYQQGLRTLDSGYFFATAEVKRGASNG
ncbi:MAG: SAM-dependent methyltransferase [Candidatus Binatia bacterium]|nr:SAM-dependent methyltransferase [Candidatus Binatia bacterium]